MRQHYLFSRIGNRINSTLAKNVTRPAIIPAERKRTKRERRTTRRTKMRRSNIITSSSSSIASNKLLYEKNVAVRGERISSKREGGPKVGRTRYVVGGG